jgi:hypothetical protein
MTQLLDYLAITHQSYLPILGAIYGKLFLKKSFGSLKMLQSRFNPTNN